MMLSSSLVWGQGGYIANSADGVKWARKSAGITRDFNDVCYSGGQFIAVCKAPDAGSGAKIWVSAGRQQELVALGGARVQTFSWERCATETLDVYRKLAA